MNRNMEIVCVEENTEKKFHFIVEIYNKMELFYRIAGKYKRKLLRLMINNVPKWHKIKSHIHKNNAKNTKINIEYK